VDNLTDVPDVKVFIRPIPLPGGGTALQKAKDAAGLSLREIAELSGVSKPTIGNLANGKGGVERRKADAIAAALDVPTVQLFAHGDGMPPA
jgi:transcriptional regulator with XRE-family HTH domain